MKIASMGGNQKWHDYNEYYGTSKNHIGWKYKLGYAKWYKRDLQIRAYGFEFAEPRPFKTLSEGLKQSGLMIDKFGAKTDNFMRNTLQRWLK